MAPASSPLEPSWFDALLALPARLIERWSPDDVEDVWEPFLADVTLDV